MLEAGWEAIPGHKLTQLLGAGAFGSVWEATDKDGLARALKFIDCRAHGPAMIRSELRILRALSELRHPHIIRLHSVHATSRYIVLCMERADGNLADLRQVYQDEARCNIPWDHALELVEQAAEALDFLTEAKLPDLNFGSRGLQHCDVKPRNLLLLGDSVKVADFGLCTTTACFSKGGGWRGTPPYAAPELYSGRATSTTDQYGLAIAFCERLCLGDRAFRHRAYTNDAPAGLPIDLSNLRTSQLPVLTRALHPQPSARWPSCRAFVAALRASAKSRGFRRRSSMVRAVK